VEAADARLGFNLKDGEGPPEMIRYFAAAGQIIHAGEYGVELRAEQLEEFNAARAEVVRRRYYRA